jgi:hypothetical protein
VVCASRLNRRMCGASASMYFGSVEGWDNLHRRTVGFLYCARQPLEKHEPQNLVLNYIIL